MSLERGPQSRSMRSRVQQFCADYTWVVVKNIIGWVLILAAIVAGPLVPGPGGIPLFLIGFALITFPGKRRMTAGALRGLPIPLRSARLALITLMAALLLPGVLLWISGLNDWLDPIFDAGQAAVAGVYLAAVGLSWFLVRLLLRGSNQVLRLFPRIRRRVRPWLHRHGIRLLPPRRRHRLRAACVQLEDVEEILEIHARHHDRLRSMASRLKIWLRRMAGMLIVLLIFYWILRPIQRQWPEVRDRILDTSPLRFVIAAAMFSLFLFVFRATSWRWILRGLHHPLPLAPATRIWCASELARYLPGVIWQVVGRVYLAKPYGIGAAVSSVSQVLELVIFLLANVLVAGACLLWFGTKIADDAKPWFYSAMALIPLLLLVLHPSVFYRLMNTILRRLGKPQLQQQLSGRRLIGLVAWAILGLLWQSLAVWVLVSPLLGLPIEKWWVVAGAYCLAWSAGFTAGSLTPGGIGVREFVFVTTMQFILPADLHFENREAMLLFLGFLSILLRLWATAGELTLAAIAHAADLRGALGHPDAPGRKPAVEPTTVQ